MEHQANTRGYLWGSKIPREAFKGTSRAHGESNAPYNACSIHGIQVLHWEYVILNVNVITRTISLEP